MDDNDKNIKKPCPNGQGYFRDKGSTFIVYGAEDGT